MCANDDEDERETPRTSASEARQGKRVRDMELNLNRDDGIEKISKI